MLQTRISWHTLFQILIKQSHLGLVWLVTFMFMQSLKYLQVFILCMI